MTAKVLRGSFGAIQEQSIQAKETRPRQEELAGKANQGPGKRSLPGRDETPARGACREGHSRHTKKACRDVPCVPARSGERQASGRDKTTAEARSLPRETPTACPRSSSPTNVSLWDSPRAHVAGGRAARGTWWQGDEEKPIVANGGTPNGHFLHCLGDSDRHLMPLSPVVRVR